MLFVTPRALVTTDEGGAEDPEKQFPGWQPEPSLLGDRPSTLTFNHDT